MLTLLTFADSQATSPGFWTGFKDLLLWSLFQKTRHLLQEGTEFIRSETRQRELLEADVADHVPSHIGEEEIRAHFDGLPPRYFRLNRAVDIVEDLQLVHRFMRRLVTEEERALEPVITWHNAPDRGNTTVKICTWDRAGLFSKIAGCLSASGLNILSAQIFTRSDGVAIDSFFITDARTGSVTKRAEREQVEELLTDVLGGKAVDLSSLIARRKPAQRLYQSLEGEAIPVKVTFDNSISDRRTVIEIEAEDRVGLLYAIARTFTELELDVSVAKICTEKGAAIDSFYVRELEGPKLETSERQNQVADRIRKAIAELDRQA